MAWKMEDLSNDDPTRLGFLFRFLRNETVLFLVLGVKYLHSGGNPPTGTPFFSSCSKVNSKGYSVFDQQVRARLQRYPLF